MRAERRARAVLEALRWLGTPYCHQASARGKGADCLGLVRGVYRALGGCEPARMPPYPRRLLPGHGEPLLLAARAFLEPVDAPQSGDVLLFRMRRSHPVSHCGILVSAGRFIHAFEGREVLTTALSPPWKAKITSAFAFPEPS